MDNKSCIEVTDINKKRSSLKHPDEIRKILDNKHIQFDLDPISENEEAEIVSEK